MRTHSGMINISNLHQLFQIKSHVCNMMKTCDIAHNLQIVVVCFMPRAGP